MKRLVCKDSVKVFVLLFMMISVLSVNADDIGMDYDYQNVVKRLAPLSPQASMMQRFGNYPVDYSTGVPHISVPLYTIKVGDFELPISIDYHNSGIRVQDIATPVGLGWMLNAGGCISRTIMGTDDMNVYGTNYYSFDFFSTTEALQKMSNNGLFTEPSFWDAKSSNNGGDTQVDRYSYNICGNSGVFRYDVKNKKYKTIPYTDMCVNVYDNRCFQTSVGKCNVFSFKITDHNGIEYYFDYPECAREDWTYGNNTHVTSYYLTKILLPNQKDSIVFVYDEGCRFSTQRNVGYKTKGDEYYISSDGKGLSLSKNVHNDYSSTHTIEQAETLLREIRWNGNRMTFEYISDRPETVLYTTNNRLHRLKDIHIKNMDGDNIKTITFGNDSYIGNYALERRMVLSYVSFYGDDHTDTETYTFEYDNTRLPKYYWLSNVTGEGDTFCHEDFWGYYNGSSSLSWIPQDYANKNDADGMRWVNKYYTKAGSLYSITYPTGGKTVYDMECNQLDDGTLWGGLRVKSITDYDSKGNIIRSKEYKYENAYPSVNKSDFKDLFNYTVEHNNYYKPLDGLIYYIKSSTHDVAVSNPCVPLSADYGSPVYYYKVTEYHGTKNKNEGYDVYEYEDEHTDDISMYGIDDSDEYTQNPIQFYSEWGNLDFGNKKVLMYSVKNYDNSGSLTGYKVNCYQDVTVDTFRLGTRVQKKRLWTNYHDGITGVDNSSCYGYDNNNKSTFPAWWDSNFSVTDVWAIPSYKRLASTTEYRDGVTTKTTYGYDEDKRTLSPKQTTTIQGLSKNFTSLATSSTPLTTTYTYPFESASVIAKDMTRKNMLVPLKTTTTRNGTVMCTDSIAYGFVAGGIQQKEYYTSLGTDTLEKRLTYSYDSKGRVQSLTTDAGDCTVFVWGNRNDWPIAKIEGKTLQEIKNIIGAGMYQNIFYDNPNETMLFAAKDLLQKKNCSVIVYDHETLVGVKSVIHPNNNAEYFDYDSMGRLIRRKENKAIREEYQYNYRK